MNVLATLRENETGEERTITSTCGDIAPCVFCWVEGNFSCDCNRAAFFFGDENDPDRACGDDGFTLVRLVREDTGEVLAVDDWYIE